MKQEKKIANTRIIEILIHTIAWGFVYSFPILVIQRDTVKIDWDDYLEHEFFSTTLFCFIFYLNYWLLIPRLLFKGHIKKYMLINVISLCILTYIPYEQFDKDLRPFPKPPKRIESVQEFSINNSENSQIKQIDTFKPKSKPLPPSKWRSLFRDAMTIILTIGLSVATRMSGRWAQIEATRRDAERMQAEAELKNLRNQLNPHFLLNTLNNIYALVAFDTNKAQTAIQELSRLLQHMLYENQQKEVLLSKEINFIKNYIELMRIRLTSNVELTTEFIVPANSPTSIAPFIFISLIENAFKHGISPVEKSYINIRIGEEAGKIYCYTTNSYHPKSRGDKSGSGIGLELVYKRLELAYPNQYEWIKGVTEDGTEYQSKLTIYTQNKEKR